MTALYQTLYTLSFTAHDRVAERVRSLRDDKGASAVEYALLIGVLAIVVVAAVYVFGTKLSALFNGMTFSTAKAS